MTSEIGKHSTMIASILLSILWTVALVRAGNHQGTPLDEKSTVLLQHAVKSLLGFRDLPSRGTDASLSMSPATFEVAPKYMLDLYNKYKYGAITKGKKTSNTVRSIKPQIGVINGEYMFVFNLSSVMASEKVLSGEIHLYKRKLKGLDTTLRLRLHEISPSRLSKTGIVKMQTRRYGWQAVDITSTVKSCVSSRGQSPHLLAVSIGIEKPDGKYGPMSLDKFSQNISKPYLIVFSNDTQNITLDHLDPRFDPKDLKKVFTTGDPHGDKPIKKGKRPKRSLLQSKLMTSLEGSNPMLSDRDVLQNAFASHKLSLQEYRRKRSIFDNEIPEESQAVDRSKSLAHNLPKTHPGMLQGRQQSKNKSKDSKLIPYPERYEGRRHRRRKYRKNRRRKNRNRHLPFPKHWKKKENLATFGHKEQLCGKRKLVVDFADIGWSEWIISPKSFEAHYCAGKCPFPLTKGMKPSNHATIQSIVHAIGLHSHVPSPCCVPDSMSSVTLLYFDENRNVVLKNYPSMTVQSCACR